MDDNTELVLEILEEILGDPKKQYPHKSQYGYNCIHCDEGRNKGNLEVNIADGVFKCWSCGDTDDMHGSIRKLIKKFGNKKQLKVYNVIEPEEVKVKEKKVVKLKLPEGYTKFSDSSPVYPVRRQAYNYLLKRGITDDIIEKFSIGFCDKGNFIGRIIIPSFDKNGNVNYFIARSWDPNSRAKYKNPEAAKDEIIFNENLINWDKDIVLVEGVFDSIFVENSIPMLGKHMSSLLFEKLYNDAKGNITIALDGDAFDNAIKLYEELNGGNLYGRIKIVKLPLDRDIADLRGNISEYYIEIK